MKIQSAHNGICNTCNQPVTAPYRYSIEHGQTRGCIAACHDRHIARNTKPSWMSPRMVKPAWVTEAQRAFKTRHGVAA